tara:strand:- start:46360 stop:46701 length:342 start_codon:yes stop_codon:yes gene_type:complete
MNTTFDEPTGPLRVTERLRRALDARPRLTRWLLAGPGAVAAALLFAMAMPVWLPKGAAGIDNIAFPLILVPLIWAVVFVYACVEESLLRCTAVMCGTAAVCGLTAAMAFAGWI